MSIIYEALRKIEAQGPSVLSKPVLNEAAPEIDKKKSSPDSPLISRARIPNSHSQGAKPFFTFRAKKITAGVISLLLTAVFIFLIYNFINSPSAEPALLSPPTPPSETQLSGSNPLALEGIVYDDKMPLAIINARVYKHYDRLGEYMVIDIGQREVTLRHIDDDSLLHLALPF